MNSLMLRFDLMRLYYEDSWIKKAFSGKAVGVGKNH